MPSETLTVEGHIIDSDIISRVLQEILDAGATFEIEQFDVGRRVDERSRCRIRIHCDTEAGLEELITQLAHHGGEVGQRIDATLVPADRDGAFPENFYSTTNQATEVRHEGRWHLVRAQEMDCGVRWNAADAAFECVPIVHVRRGDPLVVGHQGIRVLPLERGRKSGAFEFMSSAVSSEKPKNVLIREIAEKIRAVRDAGQKVLLVGGPAIVHTGAAPHVCRMIAEGYINVLFAGNALATHDIEQALYGTSLGIHMDSAVPAETGHEHHLRAINTIRRSGSIRAAVEQGVLRSGVMCACVRHGVDFVLAGSIRDDGPLPDVITDTLVAQDEMRRRVPDLGFVLMIATCLHSIATGNLLPAAIPVVCVDISESVVTKLSDRGSMQTVGLVTDVEPFLHELQSHLPARK